MDNDACHPKYCIWNRDFWGMGRATDCLIIMQVAKQTALVPEIESYTSRVESSRLTIALQRREVKQNVSRLRKLHPPCYTSIHLGPAKRFVGLMPLSYDDLLPGRANSQEQMHGVTLQVSCPKTRPYNSSRCVAEWGPTASMRTQLLHFDLTSTSNLQQEDIFSRNLACADLVRC